MIRRPLSKKFSELVRQGRKTTTIRDTAWPVGEPIQLYNWTGRAYCSPQENVAVIVVSRVEFVEIVHLDDGAMCYIGALQTGHPLFETEGFQSQQEMDEWFRPLVKRGTSVTKHVMRFTTGVPT